ncbi:HbrB-like protein [Mytilinidion resinicola]|uniref:HbrB-like protein n=1 Tax=Mytilinidion resinicola TaxID=574789 RepID=A0A6A6Y6M6_9PEZI|nr:HbrB-like protein [Mytilinidion resinicola]KAF2803457.1 HbrB-like protein [Mytilinidion resinicola]
MPPSPPRPVASITPSSDDDDSEDSQATQRLSPLPPRIDSRSPVPPSLLDTSGQNFSRPSRDLPARDLPLRNHSNTSVVEQKTPIPAHFGHRPRQRSQGYFEPTLSSTPTMSNTNHLTASQIAAQAAMHVQNPQHMRKRSTTIPDPGGNGQPTGKRQPASPPPVPKMTFATNGVTYQNGLVGGHRLAATTAANVAFPRSPVHSPGLPPEHGSPRPAAQDLQMYMQKPDKSKSKMKLFSKPKSIGIVKDKDLDKKHPALPSPNKLGMHSTTALNRLMMNQSTTSLVDSNMSGASSIYSSANASTSTLVPLERSTTFQPEKEKEKEKHKHHFLSRQKNKLKDKDDHHLPLSSASSNSKPTDPNAPQPLYSFAAPASPGHSSSFASGLDLRHGGRALRQKKKEEKVASLAPYLNELEAPYRERNQSFSTERSEWPISSSPGNALSIGGPSPGTALGYMSDLSSLGAAFGIPGMSPDDAWPLLKARLLLIFEGEDPRPPIEDFNALVSVHIRRCIQKRTPTVLIEDLGELLETGFSSLDQTLRHIPDDRLIPHLVEMWLVVFTTILPFLQAVLLPLDLEFKGRGPLMTAPAAADFWGAAMPDSDMSSANKNIPTLGEGLDVRRIILLTFRDTVVLPRNDTLMAIFSRLSLENLNAGLENPNPIPDFRPGTATSGSDGAIGPMSSYNSSGLLESTASSTSFPSSRSRATSNTSAGSFSAQSTHSPAPQPLPPPPPPMDSAKVTEIVGRMLQCVSVLASVQSGDESQAKMERLTKELKYNWLGRGRTGRQRRGFVGPRRGALGVGA